MLICGRQLHELSPRDRCAFRRFYRDLRIAVYANQEYTGPHVSCYQGSYGMSRAAAKEFVMNFATEVDWHIYLASK